ncbi:hypothetical protein L5515_007108 [Caenorhabditis briggsae]|uniref:G-protein coupled receptors family 1 profile domain-containing protein n=1 Tax=Caenorhabditis briggsae TaxID=6238 RepID=A0AAE9JLR6_CAEBR|nr:hypothetical protein L5515_007108 [Caenorhabditis briggsae]
MDARLLNVYISATYKIIFFIFGTIGNSLFIHLVYKRKALQCRTSILQCFQCFFHLFCSAGTLMNEVFNVGNTHIRSECYDQIAFYVFFQAAQGLLMLIIVLDILVLVKFPLIQVFGLVILKASELSDLLGIIIVHDSLFVCLSYCNTFYITMWRSKDYRDHFYRLWCPKPVQQTPKNSELVFQIRATTV